MRMSVVGLRDAASCVCLCACACACVDGRIVVLSVASRFLCARWLWLCSRCAGGRCAGGRGAHCPPTVMKIRPVLFCGHVR